jgi:hypothetical protein
MAKLKLCAIEDLKPMLARFMTTDRAFAKARRIT